ncbi:hypothetical protein [Methanolobus psychrotolerans]|uniref:hypothetical protein n=1 Tax=Methanolobus psychrotolerans TaxID=1874706 RepID=UPI000B91B00A|nr:hypothetical protein [Methanolobus psychrotolerans]
MAHIEIKYCIANLNSAPFGDEWDIEGGLSVAKDCLILTKEINDPEDKGFRGDSIFYILERWVASIPKMFQGDMSEISFVDSQEGFLFTPKGEFTFFKYFIGGSGKILSKDGVLSVEEINKRYPNHEEGTPLKTDELVLEIIRIAELFIDSIGPKIKDKSDVIGFKQSLEEAREVYDQYIMRRELHY